MREMTGGTAFLAILLSLGNWAGTFACANAAPPAWASPIPTGSAVAIIVNKQNSVDDLSPAEFRKILLGDKTRWSNEQKVTLVMLAAGPERDVVLRAICKMSGSDFNKYYLHLIFTGEVTSGPISFGTATEVREFVASTAGAIGFVSFSETGDAGKIKVIRIDGQLPNEEGYKIK